MQTPYSVITEALQGYSQFMSNYILAQQQWLAGTSSAPEQERGEELLQKSVRMYEDSQNKIRQFYQGLNEYNNTDYKRRSAKKKTIWQNGGCVVSDYGSSSPEAPLVFCVPSLINRSYIFDLNKDVSFMRYLRQAGFNPLLVEWSNPQEDEREYSLTDYITKHLQPAITEIVERYQKPVAFVGYCLGGIMSMAAIARSFPSLKPYIKGVSLLATPWDFKPMTPSLPWLQTTNMQDSVKAAQALQKYFLSLAPEKICQKFANFAGLERGSRQALDFIATEQWCQDLFPAPIRMLEECMQQFMLNNALTNNNWNIAGDLVDFSPLKYINSLVIMSQNDYIVPMQSARAIMDILPFASKLEVPFGHVGLMASRRAQHGVWQPMVDWLDKILY